jgi:hypothetical protein
VASATIMPNAMTTSSQKLISLKTPFKNRMMPIQMAGDWGLMRWACGKI